jgi:hypothetical protein
MGDHNLALHGDREEEMILYTIGVTFAFGGLKTSTNG